MSLWAREESFAPVGIVFSRAPGRGSRGGRGLRAPSFASRSAASFPRLPLLPLTHIIAVVLLLSDYFEEVGVLGVHPTLIFPSFEVFGESV